MQQDSTLVLVEQRCTRCQSPLRQQRLMKVERGDFDKQLERQTWRAFYQCRCGRRGRREW